MTVTLTVTERTGTAQSIRRGGSVPGVVYGPKQEPISVAVPQAVLEKMVREAGESTVLVLEGIGEPVEVLIHDVSFDAHRGGINHVDFYAIEAGKEVTVNVPLEFTGEAPAVKLGGSLTKVLHEVEVTCRPSALPQQLTVDVSTLTDFEVQIQVSDLVLPAGVTVSNSPEEVIALVQEVKEEEEVEVEVDMEAVEVEQKGKEEN